MDIVCGNLYVFQIMNFFILIFKEDFSKLHMIGSVLDKVTTFDDAERNERVYLCDFQECFPRKTVCRQEMFGVKSPLSEEKCLICSLEVFGNNGMYFYPSIVLFRTFDLYIGSLEVAESTIQEYSAVFSVTIPIFRKVFRFSGSSTSRE